MIKARRKMGECWLVEREHVSSEVVVAVVTNDPP